MMTKFKTLARFLGVGFLASAVSLTAGCGANDDLDLSQLALASEDRIADVPTDELGFQWVRPSPSEIYCLRAPCPAYMISSVNVARDELTYAIDWRALKLAPTQQQALNDQAAKLLLFGRYAIGKAFGEQVKVFQVTRAHQRVSEQSVDVPAQDRYYAVRAGSPSCQQPPCLTLTASLLNGAQDEPWSGVDLTRLGLRPAAAQLLLSELQTGAAYVSARVVSTMPVVLTEAFRPYNAQPLP